MNLKKLCLLVAVSAVLSGCANPDNAQVRNAAGGAVVGAAAGVLIGDNKKSAATGAVVGGLIGSQIR